MSDRTVWIINHYAKSPGEPGGTRHFDLARHLCDLGWKPCIFAARIESNDASNSVEQVAPQEIEGVRFRWLYAPAYEGNGIKRIINMGVFAWKLLDKETTKDIERPSVIIGSTVHLLAAAAAALLAKRYRVPFIFEVRDIWPETLIAMGYTRRHSPLARALGSLERWLCRQAAQVVSVLPGYGNYLRERNIPPREAVHIPNGVNLDNIGEPLAYRKQDKFRITYLGAHGMANDLQTLVRAMEMIELTHGIVSIECHLIGAGAMKQALMDYCADKGVKQVFFHPPVNKNAIRATAADTQAFVLCGRKLPSLYKYGISMNKIPDYMAMGRPVIIAMESVNNPIIEADAGICVQAEAPEELAGAIMKMAQMNEAELREMGLRGRGYVEREHDMKLLAQRLAGVMEQCLESWFV
ncbi:MAG: glycosyltransferase family 4 protein [Gammaproteobacteria bacterium]|nr:glycosyltransferase family 4 protein [Gammaproteobacteria bacterium]